MYCPLCTTQFLEVSLEEICPKCRGCVNPWKPSTAILAIDDYLRSQQVFVAFKSVVEWQAIIEATVNIHPGITTLTEAYTRRLLQWIYNNPPTPVQLLTVEPGDNDMWRADIQIQAFLTGLM